MGQPFPRDAEHLKKWMLVQLLLHVGWGSGHSSGSWPSVSWAPRSSRPRIPPASAYDGPVMPDFGVNGTRTVCNSPIGSARASDSG